jgi:hypothetical protein
LNDWADGPGTIIDAILIVPSMLDLANGAYQDWPKQVTATLPEKGKGNAVVRIVSVKKMKTYFAYSRSMGAIKIGRSAAPDKRIADMRTACPDVVIAGVLDGDLENQYHQQFKQLKISREWFRAEDDLADFLRREFLFKLPYNKAKLALTAGRGDSLQLAADEIAAQTVARAPLLLNRCAGDFFDHWYDLLGNEYPECEIRQEERADHYVKYHVIPIYCGDDVGECFCEGDEFHFSWCHDGDHGEEICETCDDEDRFRDRAHELQSLWKQVFGYSFVHGDDDYFRLTVAFWLPGGSYQKQRLLERCGEIESALNEHTDLFAFEYFFVARAGRVLESNELFFELHPEQKAEHDAWNGLTEEQQQQELHRVVQTFEHKVLGT